MTSDFDPREILPSAYRERIRELDARLAAERAAASKTERELTWWREGLELFALEAGASPADEPETTPSTNGTKPVLREAIMGIMRDGKRTGKDVWKAPEMIRLLGERGWLPNGDNAEHIVRSRLSTLTKADELERVGYGQYALPKADAPDNP